MVASIGGKWLAFTGPLSVSGCAQELTGFSFRSLSSACCPNRTGCRATAGAQGSKGKTP